MKITRLPAFLAGLACLATTTPLSADSWKIDSRCFLNGASGTFDSVAVKDPSIVYSGGNYHLFYTGRSSSAWNLGYARASSIAGLKSATHTRLTSIGTGAGLAAPQVFYFPVKGKWFLIYQNGTTPSFSTNTDVANPSGWTAARSMGFADSGIDYWCISNGTDVFCFYSANDGSHTIKRRSTSVANFPYSWSSATVVATDTFEGVHVYKNNADGQYYMMVESMGASRWFELWKANYLGGPWTKQQETWAHISNCTFTGETWTNQVSHGEILRAGTDERLTINSITAPQILIQGTTGSGTYSSLPYDLGLMHK
jgi:hypothetical protein